MNLPVNKSEEDVLDGPDSFVAKPGVKGFKDRGGIYLEGNNDLDEDPQVGNCLCPFGPRQIGDEIGGNCIAISPASTMA